jgi:hypothetical protein
VERIAGDLREELARFGPASGMAELVAAWPAAVGEQIARNAWPARIARDGTLHVHTSEAVWAFGLGQRAAEMAARLGVPKLRFAPGPLPSAAAEAAAERAPRRIVPGERERAQARELVAGIGDDELRELVARAAAASLARAAEQQPDLVQSSVPARSRFAGLC